ncbi:2-nitropropane dioxygenase [Moniliophthora roreri MCA 2997]|uniref:2-nitropropane dioxygenase n=2 Tax=Moniliophthora roreri TaxID=221103 RepID=V2YCB2_MONRO|nr:2-nitropropane dioxygenase [Moniliophthora roreri MCA 2997]KAI3597819.1 2-nitropropane dioxygenase [Moniliophthora roreri]
MATISTPITELFGIKHPVLLAGMNVAAGPELAAAVTNAGGLGVIGGFGYTPKILRQQIKAIKEDLKDKDAPFGVDLLLPQVGGNARKTNYDYTKGHLNELIDVIIEEKSKLFVCAVGVPPKHVVERLHKAGIPVMNMVGHPKHVEKALEAGVDIICAQAGEGGGHTGDTPASVLIPACVDLVKGRKAPLNGKPVYVIGAGAVYDGRSLAANLMWGAQAVWVGTRFVASVEAGAPKMHKEMIVKSGFDDNQRTVIFTGRPLRVYRTPYVADWEANRQEEIKALTSKGIIPVNDDLEKHPEKSISARPWLMGSVAGLIKDILPAKDIVENMVNEAAEIMQQRASLVKVEAKSKL